MRKALSTAAKIALQLVGDTVGVGEEVEACLVSGKPLGNLLGEAMDRFMRDYAASQPIEDDAPAQAGPVEDPDVIIEDLDPEPSSGI
jgi:hypothetical protein